MKRILLPTLLVLLFTACAQKSWLYKGSHEGVDISYRWSHPANKPSELLLSMRNTTQEDKRVDIVIDLFYQGRTVESLLADTCIRVGQTLDGKMNGFFFVPERITTAQIKDGGVSVELTNTSVSPSVCR